MPSKKGFQSGSSESEGSNEGILATTSFFTDPARQFIEENEWRLEGRDFHSIVDWLKEYQEQQLRDLR